MGRQCIAAACSSTSRYGGSFFRFPRNPDLRKKWAKQVKRTRDRWSGPTEYSLLCEKHFTEDCFEPEAAIAAAMGLSRRKRLKPDAIPTVFERPRKALPSEAGDEPSCSQLGKRRADRTVTPIAEKRPRGAYLKRERARVRCEHKPGV